MDRHPQLAKMEKHIVSYQISNLPKLLQKEIFHQFCKKKNLAKPVMQNMNDLDLNFAKMPLCFTTLLVFYHMTCCIFDAHFEMMYVNLFFL